MRQYILYSIKEISESLNNSLLIFIGSSHVKNKKRCVYVLFFQKNSNPR